MSLGRRQVSIHEASRWVFNRMAQDYEARPPYPAALIDALAELAGPEGSRIGDLGAGIGHLALPLAARGYDVVAVEPAVEMLDRLRASAANGPALRAVHASAEAMPIDAGSLDLAIIADALHFLDAELTGRELGRVLAPHGALAIVSSQLTPTPFMRGVVSIIEEAVPRRPRDLTQATVHLSSLGRVPLTGERCFHDQTPVDRATLERMLRSISFIGPAMNPGRFAAFRARIDALREPPIWARTFVLRWGRRAPRNRFVSSTQAHGPVRAPDGGTRDGARPFSSSLVSDAGSTSAR
jgi:ubiquinone/menaquinone biosynthesis C-methylase UbiE